MVSTPPPTTNYLDPLQRNRLLRSTRKLGAILGTTPFLLEPVSHTNSRKRHPSSPSSSSSSPSSSVSSFLDSEYDFVNELTPVSSLGSDHDDTDTAKLTPSSNHRPILPPLTISTPTKHQPRNGPQPLPQPLLLRLRAVPLPHSDARIAPQPNPYPSHRTHPDVTLSPLLSPTDDLSSPTLPSIDSDRRRKMAKLTRTLGENIPPELVFGSVAPKTLPPKRTRSCTTTTTTSRPRRTALPPRPLLADLAMVAAGEQLTPDIPAHPSPLPFSSMDPIVPPTKRNHRPRSLTLTSSALNNDSGARHVVSIDLGVPSPRAAVHAPENQNQKHAHKASRSVHMHMHHWGKRKEREWSGEWNVQDMDTVVKALRGLRA